MSALWEGLPSTTKSCGTLTTLHWLSSVPGSQRGSVQAEPGTGVGVGLTWRPREIQPAPLPQLAMLPIQQELTGEQLLSLQNCHVSHVSSAQHASMHACTSEA